jgi:hypothetical protein
MPKKKRAYWSRKEVNLGCRWTLTSASGKNLGEFLQHQFSRDLDKQHRLAVEREAESKGYTIR